MVEFVLLVPLFVVLVFGMLSAGIVYNRKLDLTHSAREGARYGAALPQLQCTPASKCGGKTWAQLVRSIVVGRSEGAVNSNNVCVALVNGATGVPIGATFTTKSDGTRCYDDGNGDTGMRVQVQITRSGDSIRAAFFTIPVTLNSKATAKFEL